MTTISYSRSFGIATPESFDTFIPMSSKFVIYPMELIKNNLARSLRLEQARNARGKKTVVEEW